MPRPCCRGELSRNATCSTVLAGRTPCHGCRILVDLEGRDPPGAHRPGDRVTGWPGDQVTHDFWATGCVIPMWPCDGKQLWCSFGHCQSSWDWSVGGYIQGSLLLHISSRTGCRKKQSFKKIIFPDVKTLSWEKSTRTCLFSIAFPFDPLMIA